MSSKNSSCSRRRGRRASWVREATILAARQKREREINEQERKREDYKAFLAREEAPRRRKRGQWAPWSPGIVEASKNSLAALRARYRM